MSAGGRKWVGVPVDVATHVRNWLVGGGGIDAGEALGPSEGWRVKFSKATFTYYTNGTLYSTASSSQDVEGAWEFIDSRCPSQFLSTDRTLMFGLDETGKSEPIGNLILVGALVPGVLGEAVETIVGLAQTKRKHPDAYWDDLFARLDALRPRGLDYIVEKVPPSEIDERSNLNELMDASYERILNRFFSRAKPEVCRVVVDDYGVRSNLGRFLQNLKELGAEVVVEYRADDTFIETRVASVVAKHERLKEIRALNRDPEFAVSGLSIGSGNALTSDTQEWLRAWKASSKPWPWFIRRSYAAIRELDRGTLRRKREPLDP